MLAAEGAGGYRSYFEAYQRRTKAAGRAQDCVFVEKGALRAVKLDPERRMVDRGAYTNFLEEQLERVCAALLRAEGHEEEVKELRDATAAELKDRDDKFGRLQAKVEDLARVVRDKQDWASRLRERCDHLESKLRDSSTERRVDELERTVRRVIDTATDEALHAARRANDRCDDLARGLNAAERATRDLAETAMRHADERSKVVVDAIADLESRLPADPPRHPPQDRTPKTPLSRRRSYDEHDVRGNDDDNMPIAAKRRPSVDFDEDVPQPRENGFAADDDDNEDDDDDDYGPPRTRRSKNSPADDNQSPSHQRAPLKQCGDELSRRAPRKKTPPVDRDDEESLQHPPPQKTRADDEPPARTNQRQSPKKTLPERDDDYERPVQLPYPLERSKPGRPLKTRDDDNEDYERALPRRSIRETRGDDEKKTVHTKPRRPFTTNAADDEDFEPPLVCRPGPRTRDNKDDNDEEPVRTKPRHPLKTTATEDDEYEPPTVRRPPPKTRDDNNNDDEPPVSTKPWCQPKANVADDDDYEPPLVRRLPPKICEDGDEEPTSSSRVRTSSIADDDDYEPPIVRHRNAKTRDNDDFEPPLSSKPRHRPKTSHADDDEYYEPPLAAQRRQKPNIDADGNYDSPRKQRPTPLYADDDDVYEPAFITRQRRHQRSHILDGEDDEYRPSSSTKPRQKPAPYAVSADDDCEPLDSTKHRRRTKAHVEDFDDCEPTKPRRSTKLPKDDRQRQHDEPAHRRAPHVPKLRLEDVDDDEYRVVPRRTVRGTIVRRKQPTPKRSTKAPKPLRRDEHIGYKWPSSVMHCGPLPRRQHIWVPAIKVSTPRLLANSAGDTGPS